MKLDIDYGTFYWPYIDYLKIALFGSVDASLYLRATNPPVGKSDPIALTGRSPPVTLFFTIAGIPLYFDLSFQLLTQIEVVESSLDFTMFTGLSGSMDVTYGIEQETADSDIEVISDSSWTFEGHPLSLENSQNGGKFNPRVIMIPRVFIAPYSIVDFFLDVMPYAGVEIWDSSNPVTNPDPAAGSFNNYANGARPIKPPNPPEVIHAKPYSAKIKLSPPSVTDILPITDYGVEIKCSNCWDSWLSDYVHLSSIGFFEEHYSTADQCFPTTSSSDYTEISMADIDGNRITCADKCRFEQSCVAFSFVDSTSLCRVYSVMPTGNSAGGGCHSYDKLVQTGEDSYFILRDGDPLAYEASDGDSHQISTYDLKLLDDYEYAVRYRAANSRGFSDEFSDSAIVKLEFSVVNSFSDDMYYMMVDFTSNLPAGEFMKLEILEDDDFSSDDLINYVTFYTTDNQNRQFTFRVSAFYGGGVYTKAEDSNDHEIYLKVVYSGKSYDTSNPATYNPVSDVAFSASNNNRFTFKADDVLFSKIDIYKCTYDWLMGYSCPYYNTYADMNSYCYFNDCTIVVGSSSYTHFKMVAFDTEGSSVSLGYYTGNRRRLALEDTTSRPHISGEDEEELIAPALSLETRRPGMIRGSNSAVVVEEVSAGGGFRPMKVFKSQKFLYGTSTRVVAMGDDDAVTASSSLTCGSDELSYEVYYGVMLRVGMGKFTVPVLGLVLFQRMTSPRLNLVGPTKIPGSWAAGCLAFPPLAPQLVLQSPLSTDSWQFESDWHSIAWNHWSLDASEEIQVCYVTIYDVVVYCDSQNYLASLGSAPAVLPPSLLVDEQYRVRLYSPSTGYKYSDAFSIVGTEISISVTSFDGTPIDDAPASFTHTLLTVGALTVELTDGTFCQAKYTDFPMSVSCAAVVDIKHSGTSLYKFDLNGAVYVDSVDKLSVEGVQMGFGSNFPEFKFPASSAIAASVTSAGSKGGARLSNSTGIAGEEYNAALAAEASSYFFEKLGDSMLTGDVSFPGSAVRDMMKVNTGSTNRMCLRDLLDLIDNDSSSGSSDLEKAARNIESLLDILGVQACLNIELSAIDLVNIGAEVQMSLDVDTFKKEKIDWASLFNSIENSYFQSFLLLSGSATESMAADVFDELLKMLDVEGGVSVSFDLGEALLASLPPSTRKLEGHDGDIGVKGSSLTFLSDEGKFLLGSAAVPPAPMSPIPPSAVPTALPTAASDTAMPTAVYDTNTVVTFSTLAPLVGIVAADMDLPAQEAFLSVTASSMEGVEVGDLVITDMVTASSESARRLSGTNSAVDITFTTRATLDGSGYSTAVELAEGLEAELATAFADPNTATEFTTMSEDLGSITVTSNTVVDFNPPVLDYSSITEENVTPSPTAAPPDDTTTSGAGGSGGGDSGVAMAIGVSVSIVVLAGAAAVALYFLYWKKKNVSKDEQQPGPDNTSMEKDLEMEVTTSSSNPKPDQSAGISDESTAQVQDSVENPLSQYQK